MDIGQENVARGPGDGDLILLVQGELKIIAPVAAVHAVVREHRILEEDPKSLKVSIDAVEHDDVGRDDQKVARQLGVRLVEPVEETPRQRKAEHLGLAASGSHLDYKTPPCLAEHACRYQTGCVEAHHVVLILNACNIVQVNDRFQCFALGKIVLKLRHGPVGLLQHMRSLEPPVEQALARVGRADVAAVPELLHFLAQLRYQGRHEFFHARFAQGFIGRKPANIRIKDSVRRIWEVFV